MKMKYTYIFIMVLITLFIINIMCYPIKLEISLDSTNIKIGDNIVLYEKIIDKMPFYINWVRTIWDVDRKGSYRLDVKRVDGVPVSLENRSQYRSDVLNGKIDDILPYSATIDTFRGKKIYSDLLNGYYNITKSGTYTVQMIAEPVQTSLFGTISDCHVKSNIVTFTVVPAESERPASSPR